MNAKLFFQAITKMIAGFILVGLFIFLPAGTLFFFNGWLFMALLFVPMFLAGIIMMIKCPELFKNRLTAKETQKEQGLVVRLSALMFISGFIVAGLDFQFGLSALPKSATTLSVLIFLLAYLLYAEVIRENIYLSRTIQVQENQKVIDTGLYAIVRHPMYTATIFLFLTYFLRMMPIFVERLFGIFLAKNALLC